MVSVTAIGKAWATCDTGNGAAANAMTLLFLMTWLGMPDSYPDPLCPGNVPPWWPGFIPA
ncbi:hypothetical protein SAMN06272735_0405 [Streptomyces sp. TLI_55]|uniref:hypothetical protein n=1 Tax=Streptomyces sp. TLI_55 TaxID=1938861 RepID=UPI000BCB5191|nr:hypothetical protein [Streptomyces sp. TLI_55]SNX55968.1 hypothetical protein SAMN06272735_0405 [Streptomyces sp. TLI_55]